jgi:hypothetical protein
MLIVFTRQQWLRERATMLCSYAHCILEASRSVIWQYKLRQPTWGWVMRYAGLMYYVQCVQALYLSDRVTAPRISSYLYV